MFDVGIKITLFPLGHWLVWTLQNWLGDISHDYVKLQNLNLIIQNLIAPDFERLALQYAISSARYALFAIPSHWKSFGAAHVLQVLSYNVAPVPNNPFRSQRGQQSRSRSTSTGMFIPEGPEDKHFVFDVPFKDKLEVVNSKV